MKIYQKDTYTLITPTENSFDAFIAEFKEENDLLYKNHTVIELSDNLNSSESDLSLFLNVAKKYKAKSFSFIIICDAVNMDEISEEINVVPTLLEAEDMLEMEAIERDLGF
ncbi:MAG: hypothetical protein P8H13_06625 [Polaribacter sp.]|nr:hypothetical protein [Polaribacter sp.]MDG1811595.1 hypothetical protein [Polaribacter sp.]MDG2073614.1 hypothetical protein [Polaribacter sp.]